MLKNYFKIAWRNITRHKIFSFINILGLSLGICTCIVIFLISRYELSTDAFHPDKDRIYRLVEVVTHPDGNSEKVACAPLDISQTVRAKFTGAEAIAQYYLYAAKISVPGGDQSIVHYDNSIPGTHRPSTILAEPEYFNILQYKWLAGNALTAPNTVVLTETSARKYFGKLSPERWIGRKMVFNDSLTVTVTGIIQDWKDHTDMPFTEFISFSTAKTPFLQRAILADDNDRMMDPFNSRAFVKIPPGVSPDRLAAQLHTMDKSHKPVPGHKYELTLQPLSKIHFDGSVSDGFSKPHLATEFVLMGIAAFILLLATINFINLSTALSIRRAKEIGMRKVMGGSKTSIALQFLAETFLLTTAALVVALLAVKPMLFAFQSFIPEEVNRHLFDVQNAGFIVLLVVVTTVLAGFYPARVLSDYLPVLSLKGAGAHKGQGKWNLRRGLIVFQFAISLIFIISTTIISKQVNYMRTQDLGFNADAVVSLDFDPHNQPTELNVIAEKMRQLPGVQKIALQSFTPLSDFQIGSDQQPEGKAAQQVQPGIQIADSNFLPLYDIHLLAGRNLVEEGNRDSVKEFVVNETLARAIGCTDPRSAVGRLFYFGDVGYPIVGVVGDFHENSYRQPIRPLIIFDIVSAEKSFAVKLAAKGKNLGSVKNTLAQMEQIWKGFHPESPFVFHFFDETIAAMYKNEQKTATLMNVATAISIFISCMGLFGLSMFTAGQRRKEIGIRKVLGASVTNIASLLTRDLLLLVSLSLVIASPIAWYITHRWLQDYLYRAPISIWVFLLSGGVAVALGLLTVSFQAIRAAMANPVNSLRAE